MNIEFIPIDYDSFDFQGRNYIRMIGRDSKGKQVCVIDSLEPYLWAILKENVDEKKIKELEEKIRKIKIESTERTTRIEKIEVQEKNFLGKQVKALKIFITNYKDAHPVADKLDFPEIEARREYDINIVTKYIIEKGVIPCTWFNVSGEILNNSLEFGGMDMSLNVSTCVKADKIHQIKEHNFKFEPKILAFDIETDELEIGKGEILMISLVGKSFKKVLTWKKCTKCQDFVEYCKDEADMIEKFSQHIKKLEPDFLVGYFSDGFDLPYLRARAEKNKIRLSLGIDGKQPTFARGRIPSGRISGITHIDLLRFIETVYSQYLKSETLSLNEVASELIGEKKNDFDHRHSSKINHDEWLEYFEYNLQDSILTYKLAEKVWPDMLEFGRIIQEPLFEITRDSMSQLLEHYILHHLSKYKEIAEKRPIHDELTARKERRSVEGAFVFQPKAGLYNGLAIFDFTSMHTSIIVSFNISGPTLIEKTKDSYESPEVDWEGNKARFYFSKKRGFLPDMFEELIEKRKSAKKEYKQDQNPITKARSNAFKLLTAAVHGYIGFFGARYYSLESSASILAFVRQFNKEIIEKVQQAGFDVIYGDTDSTVLTLNKHNKQEALALLKKLNDELPGIMELELEDFYSRGLWVTKRTGEFGAKKKYALIDEKGKLKIRGFETVRRDWCDLARDLQNKVLNHILKEGNEHKALEITKEVIKDLKERKVPREDIMIKTQLKKEISEYKSISPHVIAAKKMQEQGMPVDIGMLLRFFIAETRNKKSLIRDKVKLPDEEGEYNLDYYINHQIVPAVENIFQVFGITPEDLVGKKQTRLGEF